MQGGTEQHVTASSTGRVLRDRFPGGDVKVRHEPGGVRASVSGPGGGLYVSVGDQPGVLSAWLGIEGPGGPHDDGGEELDARHAS